MTSAKQKTIKEKLDLLDEVIDKLKQCAAVPKEDFIADFLVSDAALHNLVLGIEIIVDIGNHILSEAFHVGADSYKETIEKLGETGVVPRDFAKKNADMAKFRNLIIHAYGEIDMKQVYQNLQKAPDIFRKFAEYFSDF